MVYFESQLELFVELEAYLVKQKRKTAGAEENINTLYFPKLADTRSRGRDRLYNEFCRKENDSHPARHGISGTSHRGNISRLVFWRF